MMAPHLVAVLLGLGGWRVERRNILVQQLLEVGRLQRNMFFTVQSRRSILRWPKVLVKGHVLLRLQRRDREGHEPAGIDYHFHAAGMHQLAP